MPPGGPTSATTSRLSANAALKKPASWRSAPNGPLAKARADPYARTPKGKIAALTKGLADAEADLATKQADKAQRPAKIHPDQARDGFPLDRPHCEAAAKVTMLRAQIVESEARLPFHNVTEDELVNQAAAVEADLAPLREQVAKVDAQVKNTGIADTSFTAQRVRRDLAAAEAKLKRITDEMGYRKRDARNAVFTLDREVRTAMTMRAEALKRWTAEERRLLAMLNDPTQSGLLDLGELRAARKAKAMLEKAKTNHTPVGSDELESARERIASQTNIVAVGPGAVEIESW